MKIIQRNMLVIKFYHQRQQENQYMYGEEAGKVARRKPDKIQA